MLSEVATWIAVCVIAWVTVARLGQSDEPSSVAEFMSSCDSWLPSRGSIVLSYESTRDGGAGRRTIGMDAQSRAWFRADSMQFIGVTPDGRGFIGETEVSHARFPEQNPPLGLLSVADELPQATLFYLRDQPGRIIGVSRSTAREWIVQFEAPSPAGSDARIATVTVDDSGVPVLLQVPVPGGKERRIEYTYDDESVPGFLIAGDSHSMARLDHMEFIADGRSEVFEPETVEGIARDNRMAVELQLEAIRRNNSGSSPTSPQGYSGSGLRSSRWPLIGTGLVAIVVGLLVIFRTRTAR